MKKFKFQSYLFFLIALFFVMSLSTKAINALSGKVVSLTAPLWEQVQNLKESKQDEEILHLALENELLKNEISRAHELLGSSNRESSQSVPARVIFRSPSSWNSSFWINVGKKNNEKYSEEIIQKNSPVLVGSSVVGVVDFVGDNQSRVRLITDSGLTPSVRVERIVEGEKFYLAKGELYGSSEPLWRTYGSKLKGIGFNYDFPDDFGPSRDLRTGTPTSNADMYKTMPIIQVDDLLVTTGMDGVFPPFLKVAFVTGVNMLKEGDYFFEIEAMPTAGNLENISLVFVIKPLGFDSNDRPPLVGY